MTMRERILAVIDGQPVDRVPFVNYQRIAAPDEEVWSLIGRENMGLIRWSAVHTTQAPNCSVKSEDFTLNGRRAVRTTLHTPAGDLTNERLYEPTYHTTAARTHYVKEPRDYRILLAHLKDVQVIDDPEHFLRDSRELGKMASQWSPASGLRGSSFGCNGSRWRTSPCTRWTSRS